MYCRGRQFSTANMRDGSEGDPVMAYYIPDPKNWNRMEAERPCCFKEFVGPKDSWDQIGMRIRWTIPEVPGAMEVPMYDALTLRLCLECKKPVIIRNASAFAWTHIFHKDNHEGIYRKIHLTYDESSRKWDDDGVTCYEFHGTVCPTHQDNFRLTFSVTFGEYMMWVSKLKDDHVLTVKTIRPGCDMLETFQQTQVTQKIYLGNYLAMLLADEMQYDALLSLDPLTDKQLGTIKFSGAMKVIKMINGLDAGAGKEIPKDKIKDIVAWLKKANAERSKILVGDRTGLGRVGSALTAYIYANNRNMSFDEAYEFVTHRKPSAFCHKGLRETLAKLYPRD